MVYCLQSPNDCVGDPVQNSIAVLNVTNTWTAWHQLNEVQLSKLEKAAACNAINMVLYRQLSINSDIKVTNGIRCEQCNVTNRSINQSKSK